jgi:putative glutamine amidotransferase
MGNMVIGITDGRLYESYAQWIARLGNVELLKLGYRIDNADKLEGCHGLFLTGGEDMHPRYYGKPGYVSQYSLHDFDEKRDAFELALLKRWQRLNIPLLGVCRGLQITNVFLGGTLVPDLPAFGKFNHAKKKTGPRMHAISIDQESSLYAVLMATTEEVSSMHHQSIDQIAPGLVVNAVSPDGVIEGVEWLDPTSQPPVVLVQWHPEVMKDTNSPFSIDILKHFLSLVETNLLNHAHHQPRD